MDTLRNGTTLTVLFCLQASVHKNASSFVLILGFQLRHIPECAPAALYKQCIHTDLRRHRSAVSSMANMA